MSIQRSLYRTDPLAVAHWSHHPHGWPLHGRWNFQWYRSLCYGPVRG